MENRCGCKKMACSNRAEDGACLNEGICAFKVKGKELRAEDFRGKLYLKAIFRGKCKKLISGETYTVGLLKNGKVSVPVKQNPLLTKYDNGIATTLSSWEVCT